MKSWFSIKLFYLGIPTIEETPPHRSKCSILPKLARTQLAILSVTQRGMTGNDGKRVVPVYHSRRAPPLHHWRWIFIHHCLDASFLVGCDHGVRSSVARRAVGRDMPARAADTINGRRGGLRGGVRMEVLALSAFKDLNYYDTRLSLVPAPRTQAHTQNLRFG